VKKKKSKTKPATFSGLIRVMAKLRSEKGCPWDKEQTHVSLLKYLREESDEVAHAIEAGDSDNLEEELGDLLLQILFHSQIASEEGRFDIKGVMTRLRDKLIRRHPHVFGPGKKETLTPAEVHRRWNRIKAEEKRGKIKTSRRT